MKVHVFSLIICILIVLSFTACKETDVPTAPSASEVLPSAKECEIEISGVVLQQQDGSGTYVAEFSRTYTFPVALKADLVIDVDTIVKRSYSFGGIDNSNANARPRIHLAVDPATTEIRSLSVHDTGGFSVTGTRMINYTEWFVLECDNSVYKAVTTPALPCRYEILGDKNAGFIRKALNEMSGSIGTTRSPGMGGGFDWSYYSTKTLGFSANSATKIVVTLR